MSTPRDRDGDAFDDGRADGPAGWQEPAHLGGEGGRGGGKDTPDSWQPPGWDLPAVEPAGREARPEPWQPPAADQRTSDEPPPGERRRGLGGLLGSRPTPGEVPDAPAGQPIMVPPADPWGTQAWAMSVGWVLSDGTAPEDEPLTALVQSAPVRPGRDDRASRVLRGRGNGLDLVAFDIVSPVGRSFVSTHAVTAAPVLGEVPAFRLSPARMWRHGTGGLVQVPSPDPEFDRRWVLLAAADGPQVRRLVEDPLVRQLLLGSDDGDELWSAVGFVAAVRPDGNRPQLIEHHARLLAAVVAALAAAR
ncbi:hypothetical protein [Modestobacter altitudinis]|uniref:hypothetical protein n=1 Tax=Modestobacter altitudinis TaxID=2213158 RepID=UPI00110D23F9|nr:hypothetical protein [Modestobacter altitudinis]